ncbi:ABC transporter substrate-binding protein [Siculibacillus lacustris]|nr:extracellular solute-binding protein [Siculibacillus lacustris]
MKRRSVLLGGAALALTGLTSVGRGPAQAADTTAGRLSIWLGYGETAPAFKAALPAFKALYPNVEVELLSFDLHEYEAKLSVAVPTGNGPDILTLHDYIFPHYYDGDALDDVPADLAKVVDDPKIIDPVFKDVCSRDGKPWGVPWWKGSRAFFYNVDHFKEAGLDGPPKTLKEMWDYSEKLTKKAPDGTITRAGITLRLTEGSGGLQKFSDHYYASTGHQILEAGPKPGTVRVTLKDKDNLEAGTKLLLDYVAHLHGPKKVDDWALKHDTQGFANGLASMLFREDWAVAFIRKNGPDVKFATAPLPRDKAWGNFHLVEILSVNKTSKMKKPAWDLIRLLQEQQYLDIVLQQSGWVPLRMDRDFSAFLSKNPEYKAFLEPTPGYQAYLEPPNVAYVEATARTGDVILAGFRDASLLDNPEGAKAVLFKAYDTAANILKRSGIFAP